MRPTDQRQTEAAPTATTIPTAALWLGAAGLLPFVAAAVQIASGWPLGPRMTGPALFHLGAYGACILSFMAGVQWGLAVAAAPQAASTELRRYGISVLPALLAWLGLYIGAQKGLLLLAAGFAALLAYDRATVGRGEAPPWYARLRAGLSSVVILALLAAAALGPF